MQHDPTGPGTPAWEESDRAIELWPTQPRAAGMAMTRMVAHLKAAGESAQSIESWKAFVRREQGRTSYVQATLHIV
jgi:hypothetical protein